MNIINDVSSLPFRYYCLCLMSGRGLRLHFSSFTSFRVTQKRMFSSFMKIYRLLRVATLMPSFFLPFFSSTSFSEHKKRAKKVFAK